MITAANNQSPNFGALYRLKSFNNLGGQGENALNTALPHLKKFAQDCDIYIGSVKNPETGKSHLAIWAANLKESFAPDRFLGSIFVKESNSSAVNPASLITNAGQVRISVLGEAETRAAEYEDVLYSDSFQHQNTKHNRDFHIKEEDINDMNLDTLFEPREQFEDVIEPEELSELVHSKEI